MKDFKDKKAPNFPAVEDLVLYLKILLLEWPSSRKLMREVFESFILVMRKITELLEGLIHKNHPALHECLQLVF